MQRKSMMLIVLTLLVALSLTGCSSTKLAKDFSGLPTPAGSASHISTSNMAMHLMFGKEPLWGDASLEKTVADFTEAAKADGAKQVRIVQSSQRNWWFVYPPVSFFLTPVTSNVAGDAVK